MDQDFTFPVCHPTHLIHTSHSPNIPTTKILLGHPRDVSCLGLCTKLTWSLQTLSSELFYPHFKKFCLILNNNLTEGDVGIIKKKKAELPQFDHLASTTIYILFTYFGFYCNHSNIIVKS
jgi:hypothetical protein